MDGNYLKSFIERKWTWLNSPENNPGLTLLLTVLVLLFSVFVWWRAETRPKVIESSQGGGNGGKATVGGSGVAIGGKAGRGGLGGHGGEGGSAEVHGDGVAIGGAGGDSGVTWRPALGGNSAVGAGLVAESTYNSLPKDGLGLITVGQGGSSGNLNAMIISSNGDFRLFDLLRLIDLWEPQIIDEVDQVRPENEQSFWDTLKTLNLDLAERAEMHVIACTKALNEGLQPPNPYF